MIKQARLIKNMSQEDLATALGVSRQAVSKWESDKAIPTGVNRDCINSILDISLEIETDEEQNNSSKNKVSMIIGWTLSAVLAITVIILAVDLHSVKSRLAEAEERASELYKVQSEIENQTTIDEQADTEAIPGMDVNKDSTYQEADGLDEQIDLEGKAGTDSNDDTTFVQE